MSEFTGFPEAALDFYDDLEMDNTRSFWEAHKSVWTESVKAPMTALTDALADEFGAPKVFRPYRDVRFAKDKTPYKTHQGGFVQAGPATGWYVQVAASGVRVSVGYYHAEKDPLAAIRVGIDGPGLNDANSDAASAGATPSALASDSISARPAVMQIRKQLPSSLNAAAASGRSPRSTSLPVIAASGSWSGTTTSRAPEISMTPVASRAFCGPMNTGAWT